MHQKNRLGGGLHGFGTAPSSRGIDPGQFIPQPQIFRRLTSRLLRPHCPGPIRRAFGDALGQLRLQGDRGCAVDLA